MEFFSKAAAERIGILPNAKEAERVALKLYDERKELSRQIAELQAQLDTRIDDVRCVLSQFSGIKFYRTRADKA